MWQHSHYPANINKIAHLKLLYRLGKKREQFDHQLNTEPTHKNHDEESVGLESQIQWIWAKEPI